MKLDEFISSVLIDINNGIKKAKSETERNYIVSTEQGNGGVHFDIAVVAGSSTITQSGGTVKGELKSGLKLEFVKVLSGKVEGNIEGNVEGNQENREENSRISRIQFNVSVHHHTNAEAKEDYDEYKKYQNAKHTKPLLDPNKIF